MKKLLVFMLILCTVSVAGALQISVNGLEAPADSTIFMAPYTHIMLDIHADTALAAGFANTWALIVNSDAGFLTAAGVINPAYDNVEVDPPYDIGMVAIAMAYGDPIPALEQPFPMLSGVNGMFGLIVVFEGTIPAGTWLVDYIDFECTAPDIDAVIQLVQLDDNTGWPTGFVYDTVTIHQIPEPATIALLCLGGLLLRKK